MTREEAKEILQGSRITSFRPNGTARVKEALNMAIEALQASTDGDSISRQSVINTINRKLDEESYEKGYTAGQFADRPHGEWIKAIGMMPPEFHGHHCCSECGNFANMESPFGNREDLSNFCPNCGAIMIGGVE